MAASIEALPISRWVPHSYRTNAALCAERYLKCGSFLVFDLDPETVTAIVHSKEGEQHFKSGDTFANSSLPWLIYEIARLFSTRK